MKAHKEIWRRDYRLARQLNGLRKRFESRLPERGFCLFTHAAVMTVFGPVDPLKISVGARLGCMKGGFRHRLGKRPRLPA